MRCHLGKFIPVVFHNCSFAFKLVGHHKMNIVLSAHKISTPVLSTYGALHKDAPEPSRHQSDFFVILINHRAGFTAVFPVCV